MTPSDYLQELSLSSKADTVGPALKPRFTPGRSVVEPPTENYEYEHLKPNFPSMFYPPLEEVPYNDKGLLGDPEYKNLLVDAVDCFDYHPKVGTEVVGVKLKNLTDAQKNDLGMSIRLDSLEILLTLPPLVSSPSAGSSSSATSMTSRSKTSWSWVVTSACYTSMPRQRYLNSLVSRRFMLSTPMRTAWTREHCLPPSISGIPM
jgi:hypothetical protein